MSAPAPPRAPDHDMFQMANSHSFAVTRPIRGAVIDCYDEDMRTREVAAALDWLVKHGGIKDGTARATCARATYDLICSRLNQPDPAIAAAQRMRRMKRRAGND